MWLIVGLGNPGPEYELTRHNIGFLAIDYLLKSLQSPPSKNDFQSIISKFKMDGIDVVCCKPQTFMNLSGQAVQAVSHFYKIDKNHLVVIHDDIDLDFGKIRIFHNRGHGGHNGVRDISAKLGTNEYLRIKLGVGRPDQKPGVRDYVLQNFSKEEMQQLPEILNRTIDAIECLIFEGKDKAASIFNR